MALVTVSASVAGSSTVTASVIEVGISGSAALTADLDIDNAVTSTLGGSALLFADPDNKLASGAVAGTGVLSPATGLVDRLLVADLAGTSTISEPPANVLRLSTAQASGTGVLTFLGEDLSATLAGSATLTAPTPSIEKTATARAFGVGLLQLSEPEPVRGSSVMSAHFVVETVPLPVETQALLPGPKALRWNQLLQRGDLPIFLRSRAGPVSPRTIFYTFFQKKGQALFQIGPAENTPVQAGVGEYYATGCLGMFGGQPGTWVIRWTFQWDSFHAFQVEDFEFLVQDLVAANDPNDRTVRVQKFGWL